VLKNTFKKSQNPHVAYSTGSCLEPHLISEIQTVVKESKNTDKMINLVKKFLQERPG
jgi:hypothetical protein